MSSAPDTGRIAADWLTLRRPFDERAREAAGSLLDLLAALRRIEIPTWFINGQFDQLRVNERLFVSQVPHAELIIVPRTSHLVTAMRPRVFNALLDVALASMEAEASTRSGR